MRLTPLLTPSHLWFALKNAGPLLIDKVRGVAPLPIRVRDHVAANARSGDAEDVLRTMDDFARNVRFLMNVGPDKGPLLQELVTKLAEDARVLELGSFCGYSAILLAGMLGARGTITSIEKHPAAVEATRDNVKHAGLSDRVTVIHGASAEIIPTLEGPFDLIFLDHWKDLYLPDLQSIERHGLLRSGGIVVADNVGEVFGAAPYLEYVRGCGRYDSENRPATVEYSQIPDAVEISVYR